MPMAVTAICIDIITVTVDSFMSCLFVCQEDFVAFHLPSYVEIIVFKTELRAASACVEAMYSTFH
jgi:hypothetical protein